ncbi:hypothetical protein [Flavobacterium aciduliphilum]|uniref:Uncharacterized protein n=1 Tax=Flavobacterium aciduliphilum TaxID=1101402 RepID=A0A328YIB3_9FLAO|nr:hypothetical protein [Flavobacterium aciduliphilum]RAR73699.1 hypothetical protein CLV55_10318 [Flavobacterium aciduliphilum]
MNTKNNIQQNTLDRIDATTLTERIKELSEIFANSFELEAMNTLQKQLAEAGKPMLSFQEELQKGNLHKQIKRMARALKKCTQNTPTTSAKFTDTINIRLDDFLFVVQEVEEYPIEKISVSLEQILQTQNIEAHSVKSFLKKFKKALIKLMIHHYMYHEETAFELLLEHELKTLKVDYLIENKALQILEPHKYNQYINSLNRGFNALYHDMKAYTDFSNPFFEAADKLFQNIMAKLNQAAGIDNPEIEAPKTTITETESKNYPTHIFRTHRDFQLFDVLMQHNPKADEIGYIFRTMSEIENPSAIVVKETAFRNWFNQESGYKMELNNPIKTLPRIKDLSGKQIKYKLQKQLLRAS